MNTTKLSFLSDIDNKKWELMRGWLLPSAAEKLYEYASASKSNGAIVEIGSYAGKSTVCIAMAIKEKNIKMTAIDVKFQLDFSDNMKQLQVNGNIDVIEDTGIGVANDWDEPVSFIYIDGDHSKFSAYADLMVWDNFIIPDGIVALDDTAGFMLGPNLQIQAITGTGAYELLSETNGVSFLKKKKNIFPPIGDFPLSKGTAIAYINYISAWSGAMDINFRLPQKPKQKNELIRRKLSIILDLSLRQILHIIKSRFKKKQITKQIDIDGISSHIKFQKAINLLRKIENENSYEFLKNKILYLSGCMDLRINQIESAIKKFQTLSEFDDSIKLIQYNISVKEMALLRLSQSYDIINQRDKAKTNYEKLIECSKISEIREQAKRGLSTIFQIPPKDNKLLLREYNKELNKYKTINGLTKQYVWE